MTRNCTDFTVLKRPSQKRDRMTIKLRVRIGENEDFVFSDINTALKSVGFS